MLSEGCRWAAPCRDLSPSLRLLLGVDNLWCDTRTEQSAQKFVLWAGHVLEHRAAFEVSCYLSDEVPAARVGVSDYWASGVPP